ncbi:hypothetical protein I4U23_009343 [Adineta vaga]|nr:hypothetical protein I4U23_009343 [Adineta vaga]
MLTDPSKWIRNNVNFSDNSYIYDHPCNNCHTTSNLRRYTLNLEISKKDDELTYRDQLHYVHGSIDMPKHLSCNDRCSCELNQSTDICKQIFDYENELRQKNYVEYVYKIESTKSVVLT